jgi:hypothetical protein
MIKSLKAERESAVSVAVAKAVAEVELFYSSLMAEERRKHEEELRNAAETVRETCKGVNGHSPEFVVDMEAVIALSELHTKVTSLFDYLFLFLRYQLFFSYVSPSSQIF